MVPEFASPTVLNRYVCTSLSPSLSGALKLSGNGKPNYLPPHFRRLDSKLPRAHFTISSSGMGRVKLKIRKLENSSGRQSTYSKRKNGLIKKANELSILCDIDVALLMFSPSGKPSLYKGQHSSIEKIIERYSRHTPQERAKRKLESLEALKKTFRKSDHDVKIRDFLGPSYISVEDLRSQAESLKTQLSEVQKKLSNWTTLDKIESIEHLGQMEISLRTSLNQLQTCKANLRKQQMEIRVNEFQDNFHLPFTFGIEEQLQPLPWVPNDHSQHMVLSNNSNLIPLRDSDCSAGTSLESYSGLLNAGEKVQQDNFLTDLNRNGASSLQPNDQFNLQVHEQQSYPSYNFGLVNDGYFQPTEQMNAQENTLDFLLDRKYEVLQFGYDPLHHSWVSASSGTCGSAMFEEHLFPQVHCSFDEHEMKEPDHMFLKAAPHSSLIN